MIWEFGSNSGQYSLTFPTTWFMMESASIWDTWSQFLHKKRGKIDEFSRWSRHTLLHCLIGSSIYKDKRRYGVENSLEGNNNNNLYNNNHNNDIKNKNMFNGEYPKQKLLWMVALVSKIILKIMITTMVIITMTKVIRSYYDDDENFNNTDDGGNVNNNVIDYYKSYMIIAYHSHLRFYLASFDHQFSPIRNKRTV